MGVGSVFTDIAKGVAVVKVVNAQAEVVSEGVKMVQDTQKALKNVEVAPEDLKEIKKTQMQIASFVPVIAAMPQGTSLFNSPGL